MQTKYENLLNQFKMAVTKYEDVLTQPKNEYIRDSAIQRFEFTFELAWKTMKVYLEKKGVKVFSPRDAIKNAFQNEIIHDDTLWLEMLETRNMTSHVYNEDMAEKIFVLLPSYLSPFKKLADNLSNSALI